MQHLAMHDFSLVDAHGRSVPILVQAAALVAPLGRTSSVDEDVRARLRALPPAVDSPPAGWSETIEGASETLVADGQTIEVIGVKSRAATPEGATLTREPAWATVIASGELPVLLVP